jgi:uncharacterized protein
MKSKLLDVPVGVDEKVSAVICTPESKPDDKAVGVIIAHGAGNDMQEPLIVRVCEELADAGYVTLRFNFVYREKGHKTPDSQAKLETTWKSVHSFFTQSLPYKFQRVIVGGKSMGGRVASQMVAAGKLTTHGLILLGYPLHSPGKKDTLRDSHLYEINIPILFFAGTRDTLSDLFLLKGVLNKLKASWDLMVIDGGDHSFRLPSSTNTAQEDVYSNVAKKSKVWVESLGLKSQ